MQQRPAALIERLEVAGFGVAGFTGADGEARR